MFSASAIAAAAQNLLAAETAAWALVGVTALLAAATGVLAVAALKALGQLGVAVQQLDEVKKDRHVLVFSDFGRRWEGPEMTEALVRAKDFTPDELVELFNRPTEGRLEDPLKEARRKQDARDKVILLRIPGFFEDLAVVADMGSLDADRFRDEFGGLASELWPKWEKTVRLLQKDDRTYFEEFANLATSIQKEEAARGVDVTTPTIS